MKLQKFIFILCGFALAACFNNTGDIEISTFPGDAFISVDGIDYGQTPSDSSQVLTISLPPGEYKLKARITVDKELEKTASQTVNLIGNEKTAVIMTLEDSLTDFGRAKKLRRDSELQEKKRLAKIEEDRLASIEQAKLQAAIAKRKREEQSAEIDTATGNPYWMNSTGWKGVDLYAAMLGGAEKDLMDVTPTTVGAYWAGRITEFHWSKVENKVTDVKIKVTWTSDRGKPCESIVQMPVSGYKDMRFRSLAMKRCS